MIENNNEVSKDLEKAMQALKQAKQRVANEKKKQNEKNKTEANSPGYSDREMGNIGTESESNPVTAHGIFSTNRFFKVCNLRRGNVFSNK